MSFYKSVPPINCSASLDWVESSPDGSVLQISKAAEKLYGPVTCDWKDVFREGDFAVNLGPVKQSKEGVSEYRLNLSDHVLVHCKGKDGSTWDNVVTGLRDGAKKHAKVNLEETISLQQGNNKI